MPADPNNVRILSTSLAAAAPHITAEATTAERERIRQLAIDKRASYYIGNEVDVPAGHSHTYSYLFRDFADLLAAAPGQEDTS